jgi:hypothetical protein
MEDYTTYPEFEGNVAVTDTQDFWRPVAESPSDTQGYHWNRNAETYFLIGNAMAEEMMDMIGQGPSDVNLDGQTDLADLAWIAAHWLETGCDAGNNFCSRADIGREGGVGLEDLLILGGNWLEGVPRLLAHWKLDELSGTVASDSVGGNDGTLNGDPTWQPTGGQIAGALELDGVGDYVEITGFTGVLGSKSRTVCAWIETSTGGGDIVFWGDPRTNRNRWTLYTRGGGELAVGIKMGFVIGTTNVCDGDWHHVAAVFANDGTPDIAETRLYVDGVEETISLSMSAVPNTLSYLDVLIGSNGTTHLEGTIDEVRIYDRALTAEEIAALAP